MKVTIRRRLQRFATPSVIGLAMLVALCAYASNLLVPIAPIPKRVASEVIPAAVINNSNSTIGVADSDIWGYFLPNGAPDTVAIDKHLDALEALGVDTIRVLIPWHGVQPLPPEQLEQLPQEFQDAIWAQTDYIINEASDRGMAILGVLNSTPGWGAAQGSGGWGPGAEPDPVKYAAYAEAVADRYKGLVSAYEIWNEPNAVPYWTPGPDPVAYTKVLKAAYAAINRADPNALVVAGVLGAITDYEVGGELIGMDARSFVAAMYANDAHGSFDALSFHPYQYTTKFSEGELTEDTPWNADSPLEMLVAIRQLMIDNGDADLRIWASEYGLPTGGPNAVTPEDQADFVADFISAWRGLDYTGPAFIYTTVDRGDGTEAGSFGIFYANWTPKPVAAVIRDALAEPDSDAFYEALAGAVSTAVSDALGQAVSDALAQAYADALAQAYADALAKAYADAWAAALAAAFGMVADPAPAAPTPPAEETDTANQLSLTVVTPAQAVTVNAETSTEVVESEEQTTQGRSATELDVTDTEDVRSGELQPAEAPTRHLVGTRKASSDASKKDSDDGARVNSGAGTKRSSANDLKANVDSDTAKGGAGSRSSRAAASS